ncbi:MAG: hypothetical protein ABR583_08865 [Gaiellaceae bacterium]
MAEPEQTEEELRERVEAELKRLKVSDVLLQSVYTISSLGYRRLAPAERDLEQARLAIDSVKALMPVLEAALPPEAISELNQLAASLQLAYAQAALGSSRPLGATEPQGEDESKAQVEDEGGRGATDRAELA